MQKRKKRVLIIARRTLTEPKAALAGVMLDISFARFKASMATFNGEIVPSRSFGRWDLASMVRIRGSYEKTARCEGCEENPKPY